MGVKIRQKVKGKDKPWTVFINHKGQRKSIQVGSKTAANKVAKRIEEELANKGLNLEAKKKPVLTFKEYSKVWFEVDVKASNKKSTAENYKGYLSKHILPVFGNLKVTEINKRTIKTFLLQKAGQGYSKSFCNQLKNVISGVLNIPVEDEIILANPALHLGKGFLKENGSKKPIAALDSDELKQLLDYVQRHFPGDYPLFLLLARTGMRISEALGLKWTDFDFNERSIKISRGLYRNRISTPKNDKTRVVDMSKQLAETLKVHETNSKRKGLRLGLGEAPEYVFTSLRGAFINPDVWRRDVFEKAIKKSGVKRIKIHGLRHTYATLRISKGDNVADVSKQLGHHSVKFTYDTYYQWIPGKKKSELDGLDDIAFQNAKNAPYTHLDKTASL
jgi:integrase